MAVTGKVALGLPGTRQAPGENMCSKAGEGQLAAAADWLTHSILWLLDQGQCVGQLQP